MRRSQLFAVFAARHRARMLPAGRQPPSESSGPRDKPAFLHKSLDLKLEVCRNAGPQLAPVDAEQTRGQLVALQDAANAIVMPAEDRGPALAHAPIEPITGTTTASATKSRDGKYALSIQSRRCG